MTGAMKAVHEGMGVNRVAPANLDRFNGKGWWIRFGEKWLKLTLRKGDTLGQHRAQAANAANIKTSIHIKTLLPL